MSFLDIELLPPVFVEAPWLCHDVSLGGGQNRRDSSPLNHHLGPTIFRSQQVPSKHRIINKSLWNPWSRGFLRESSSGYYTNFSYFLSKTLFEFPVSLARKKNGWFFLVTRKKPDGGYMIFVVRDDTYDTIQLELEGIVSDFMSHEIRIPFFWTHHWVVVSNMFIFIPIWGRFPSWLIFFRWVETTN